MPEREGGGSVDAIQPSDAEHVSGVGGMPKKGRGGCGSKMVGERKKGAWNVRVTAAIVG